MKLRLRLGQFSGKDEEVVVEWVGNHVIEFPPVGTYRGSYYMFVAYDKGVDVDYDMFLAETKQSALPCDMFGCPFPVSDLEQMFGLKAITRLGQCECGQKGDPYAKHSDYCPLYARS